MDLVFGLHLDGRAAPAWNGPANGVIDSEVVGPLGLLAALEIRLGRTRPPVAPALRMATYAAKMKAAVSLTPNRFFAASLSRDPWSTARLVLSWRDELILAGWETNGTHTAEGRLGDLAAVEREGQILQPGFADRLRELICALRVGGAPNIRRIYLCEPLSKLPPYWKELFDELGKTVTIQNSNSSIIDRPVTDLVRLQQYLQGDQAVEPLAGDGSVAIVWADTTHAAAEAIAEWISSVPSPSESVAVVAPSGDTALLDRALARFGLPAFGLSARSSFRGALQILPLAFAIQWKPLDPAKLIALLLLPRPPLSRFAAGRLANALSREPGIGGGEWTTVWAEIEAKLDADAGEDALARAKIPKTLERWRACTTGGLYSRNDGIPANAARAVASRVATWAAELDSGKGDPLLMSLHAAARDLAEAIDAIGETVLSPLLLERMIDQVIADGTPNPQHIAEAGAPQAVAHPGAIWAPFDRVVWWGFAGPSDRPAAFPWSEPESALLEASGCRFDAAATIAGRIASAEMAPILSARQQIILVRPALDAGEETISHPLAHRLDALLRPARNLITLRAESLFETAGIPFRTTTVTRIPRPLRSLPEPIGVWNLPPGIVARLDGRIESATSFEALVSCQMRWLLGHVLGLRAGRIAEIPDARRLMGTFAHALAKQIFVPGAPGVPEIVSQQALERFDAQVEAIAAPLLQPGAAEVLALARAAIPRALADLSRHLATRSLRVVDMEISRSRSFGNGLEVTGRLDMLVAHEALGLGVLDLKWSRSRRYPDEIKRGEAVQLATYGAIGDNDAKDWQFVPSAFVLLGHDRVRMITEHGSWLVDEGIEPSRNLRDTWTALIGAWTQMKNLAATGIGLSLGVPESVARMPAGFGFEVPEKPCEYCPMTRLCRTTEFAR